VTTHDLNEEVLAIAKKESRSVKYPTQQTGEVSRYRQALKVIKDDHILSFKDTVKLEKGRFVQQKLAQCHNSNIRPRTALLPPIVGPKTFTLSTNDRPALTKCTSMTGASVEILPQIIRLAPLHTDESRLSDNRAQSRIIKLSGDGYIDRCGTASSSVLSPHSVDIRRTRSPSRSRLTLRPPGLIDPSIGELKENIVVV
jgi:hypothetical protein